VSARSNRTSWPSQEMGRPGALEELRTSLRAEGLDFPLLEHVSGWDTNIHVAVLSRFPITARRSHTNDSFLLSGRRFRVSRGIAEVDMQVSPTYKFNPDDRPSEVQARGARGRRGGTSLQEARVLREKIDNRLAADPQANLVVLGTSMTRRLALDEAILGFGRGKLIDLRPAEKNGDHAPAANPTWTLPTLPGRSTTAKRIPTAGLTTFVSQGMAREW